MATPWYATREQVKRALDSAETARSNTRIDQALASATASVNRLCRRPHGFYPTVATREWPWPNYQHAVPWRLWLDENTLISLDTLTSGGIVIPPANYYLEPVNSGPPYESIEVNWSTQSAFTAGATTQRSISVAGVFGYRNDETPAGALAEALDSAEIAVDVTDSALIGVGDLVRVDSERMIVTGKTMLDTGVNIHSSDSLTASLADMSITLSTLTGAPVVDEIILVDSERMLVVDLAGTVATVKRAYDGSVLAAHAANADIYALRTLTVERGALGTTAAAHDTATAVSRWMAPAETTTLTVAEAMVQLEAQSSAYAGQRGSGDSARAQAGGTIGDVRETVRRAYRRKILGPVAV